MCFESELDFHKIIQLTTISHQTGHSSIYLDSKARELGTIQSPVLSLICCQVCSLDTHKGLANLKDKILSFPYSKK